MKTMYNGYSLDERGMVIEGAKHKDPIINLINEVIKTMLDYKDPEIEQLKRLEESKIGAAEIIAAVNYWNTGYGKRAIKIIEQQNAFEGKREQALRRALQLAYKEGKTLEAIKIHHKIAKQYPNDILNLYICFNHYIYYYDMEGGKQLCDTIFTAASNNAQNTNRIAKDKTQQYDSIDLENCRNDQHQSSPSSNSCLINASSSTISNESSKENEKQEIENKENMNRPQYDPHKDSYVLGIACFIEEQLGNLEKAKEIGERSLSLNETAPWTHHSLSHIYQDLGMFEKAIEFMEGKAKCWTGCIPFMKSHNWWHITLLYLNLYYKKDKSKKIADRMIEIFKLYLWNCQPEKKEEKQYNGDLSVVMGAIGMMWHFDNHKLEMEMLKQFYQERWTEIFDILDPTLLNDHFFPFTDLHIAYAMIVQHPNETKAENFAHNILAFCGGYQRKDNYQANAIILPAIVKAFVATREGEYEEAYQYIKPHEKILHLIGGSHAQRLALDEYYLNLCLKTKRTEDAAAYIQYKTPKGGVSQYPQQSTKIETM